MAMDRLFLLMKEKEASDMFFAVNSPVHLKINGHLIPINQQKLDHQNILALLAEVVSPEAMEKMHKEGELNVGIPLEGIGRFRLSAFRQRGSFSAVFRFVPGHVPPFDQLGVPTSLSNLIMEKRGLMLVVGATGSGKSTTIASLLDYRNELQAGHILTIEDPIEFLFRNKKSIVNQRELGSDAETLHIALKNALRQAPDCILIGEIRDKETMAAALAYAQSGHLVVATLHANNTYNALNRIISFYPIENRNALLQDLASALKAIISQRLVRAVNGGRLAAVEIMLNTRYVADLIEKGNIDQIKEAIEKSLSPGSQTFELAFLEMVKEGLITQDEAVANADSASNMLWLLNNDKSSAMFQEEAEKDQKKEESSASFTEFTLG